MLFIGVMHRLIRSIALGLSIVLFGGCYRWEAIRPTELPKLNGSSTIVVATTYPAYLAVAKVTPVQRPDGSMVEIKGRFDARLTAAGQVAEFEHPIDASVDAVELTVRSGSRAPAVVPLHQIQRLEVSQLEEGKTILLASGIGLACSVLLLVGGLALATR